MKGEGVKLHWISDAYFLTYKKQSKSQLLSLHNNNVIFAFLLLSMFLLSHVMDWDTYWPETLLSQWEGGGLRGERERVSRLEGEGKGWMTEGRGWMTEGWEERDEGTGEWRDRVRGRCRERRKGERDRGVRWEGRRECRTGSSLTEVRALVYLICLGQISHEILVGVQGGICFLSWIISYLHDVRYCSIINNYATCLLLLTLGLPFSLKFHWFSLVAILPPQLPAWVWRLMCEGGYSRSKGPWFKSRLC